LADTPTKGAEMNEDKRQSPRIKKMLVAQYSSSSTATGAWDLTTIRNISIGGALLFTDKPLIKDEIIKLLIKIPSDPFHFTEVNGQVVESRGSLTRIKFVELGDKQKQVIGDYIIWFLKNSPEAKG